jgi:outer membrane beta-barrel protein
MRKLVSSLSMLVAAAALVSPAAQAEDLAIAGPLKDAPSVRRLKQYRNQRFEVALQPTFTLLDEYRRTIFAGVRAQYHLNDWFGFGLFGAFGAASLTTDLTDQLDTQLAKPEAHTTKNGTSVGYVEGASNYPKFSEQTSKLDWVAAPQVQFVPFRGKLSLFNEFFIDADAYVHAGAAFVGVSERKDCAANCSNPATLKLDSRVAIAPTFGLGMNVYVNDNVSVGLEYRAMPFSWNRAGFDARGTGPDGNFPDDRITEADRTFKFNQMVGLSVGYSFGEAIITE